jgi:hypothetical protein
VSPSLPGRKTRIGLMAGPDSWNSPAGGSPAAGGKGASGSTHRLDAGIWRVGRGVKSLLPGSTITGPLRCPGSAARSDAPWESRAEPLVARRRPCPSGAAPAGQPGGSARVWEAAGDHGLERSGTDPWAGLRAGTGAAGVDRVRGEPEGRRNHAPKTVGGTTGGPHARIEGGMGKPSRPGLLRPDHQ